MPNWRMAARRAGRTLAAAASIAGVLLAPVATRAFADSPSATHVVQPGETLSDIANGAGVDSATLAALNAIDDANLLSVGQSIKLPVKSAPAPPSSPRTYTVAAGDTLWGVAQQFATTTAALVDANHLDDPDHLVTGAPLVLPSGAAAGTGPQAPSNTATAPTPSARPAAATTASPKRSL